MPATFVTPLITNGYFPASTPEMPFKEFLNGIFFNPIGDNRDFPLHGPNVIRFIEGLLSGAMGNVPGLLRAEEESIIIFIFSQEYHNIMNSLGIHRDVDVNMSAKEKIIELLKVAALYHDIGKYIRRSNHSQIGVNIIRNFSEMQQQALVDSLVFIGERPDTESKYHEPIPLMFEYEPIPLTDKTW